MRLGASACACTERYGPALTLGTREGGGGAGAASVPMSGSSDVALSPVFVVGGELDGKEHGVVACLAGDQGRLRLSSNAGLSFFAYVSGARKGRGRYNFRAGRFLNDRRRNFLEVILTRACCCRNLPCCCFPEIRSLSSLPYFSVHLRKARVHLQYVLESKATQQVQVMLQEPRLVAHVTRVA